jgi:hypothetical protein
MSKIFHPLVIKTKLELEKLDRQDIKTWGERHTYRGAILPISVEPKLRKRALSFMNDFLKLIESEGHKMKFIYEQCFVEAYGETTQINLRQKFYRKRIKNSYGYSHNNFISSIDLEFQIGYSYRIGWLDKKNKKIEDSLHLIFEHIENVSKESFDYKELQKIKEIKRQKEVELNEGKLRLIALENAKSDTLIQNSKDYKTANEIRVFLRDFDKKIILEHKNDENHQDYINWGHKKADELDPLI